MGALVAQAFWLSIPVVAAGILHMVAVKIDVLPRLKVPIDGGRKFRGKPIFGANKTWRGVVVMTAIGAIGGAIQGALGGAWAADRGVEMVDCLALGARLGASTEATAFLLAYIAIGAVLAFGYVIGELPNSFAKRQLDISPGAAGSGTAGAIFAIVDRLDSVVGALLLGVLVFGMSWKLLAVGVVCLPLLHLTINIGLVLTRVRKTL